MYKVKIKLNKVIWLLVCNPEYIYSNFALYILLDEFVNITVSHNCQILCVLFFFSCIICS